MELEELGVLGVLGVLVVQGVHSTLVLLGVRYLPVVPCTLGLLVVQLGLGILEVLELGVVVVVEEEEVVVEVVVVDMEVVVGVGRMEL